MQYREVGNTGIKISEIGLGCEHLEGKDYDLVKNVIDCSLNAGVNVLDCFMSEPLVRSNIGKALKGRREKVYIQGHLRTIWKNGQYSRTLDIAETMHFFDDLLERLQTDYIDFGMLHMIDSQSDYDAVLNGEIYEYALQQKALGRIRHIGISTHIPEIALQAAKSGKVEIILFSLNAAYDLLDEGTNFEDYFEKDTYINKAPSGINLLRDELYRTCAANGVGITVMKGLASGALLNERTSPFGKAMSVTQCLSYALSRAAVASVMLGLQTVDETNEALKYAQASDEEKDYSAIFSTSPLFSMKGRCMYCNHCLPCPSQINIAQVNKYLDIALLDGAPSPTLKEHYSQLAHTASECTECGTCEASCPFDVSIIERMQQAAELFGK